MVYSIGGNPLVSTVSGQPPERRREWRKGRGWRKGKEQGTSRKGRGTLPDFYLD